MQKSWIRIGSRGIVITTWSSSQFSLKAGENHAFKPSKAYLAELRHLSSIPPMCIPSRQDSAVKDLALTACPAGKLVSPGPRRSTSWHSVNCPSSVKPLSAGIIVEA